MSHEERRLMKMIDERILNSTKEELEKLQQMDINTQLDGVWFYDTCNTLEQLEQKQSIGSNSPFPK
jgi:hypothetical protein